MSVEKIAFSLRTIFAIFCVKPIAALRSRRARVDENHVKIVFCIENWYWGFIILLAFQKTYFKVKVLKTFKIPTDCHTKVSRSLKRRATLKSA